MEGKVARAVRARAAGAMSFMSHLAKAAGPITGIKTPFARNKPAPLTPLENAVVQTQMAAALYDEATNTLHVLDQSKEAKRFLKELRALLEVPLCPGCRRPPRRLPHRSHVV